VEEAHKVRRGEWGVRKLHLALVHEPVMDRRGAAASTSLTTLDLHDISRSACTFGVETFFIVTPLRSQLKLAGTMIEYWRHGLGGKWNQNRKQAMDHVETVGSLQEMVERLTERDERPVLYATSARATPPVVRLSELRESIKEDGPPVCLVMGTGAGLAPEALELCDDMIEPILGVGDYNHLSVRSAAAIMLDQLRRRDE
jgi:hypothetical protein